MFKRLLFVCCVFFITHTAFAQNSAKEYIETYRKAAIATMKQHGIPASIVLGIAMHESGSGTSKIARYLNNHFGIKGKGGPKPIKSAYKGYNNVEECYSDFVEHLEKRFSGLFDQYSAKDYKGWAKGIQRGGYAASKTWGSQVLGIIKKYNLHELDSLHQEFPKPVTEYVKQ